jgi:general stress protein CsbA
VGLFGIAIAFGKFYSMKRFIRIPFRTLSILGLMVLMACNYLGPAIMARLVSTSPSQDLAHRELWMFIWVIMLIAGSIVLIEAMREKEQQAGQTNRVFLQSPVMVYVFSTILLVASGVHQYSMSYMFALERVFGDYVPLIALVTLIALEIFRHLGRRFKYIDILISFVPLAAMLLAISEKTVVASDRLGFGLVCYPPVFFALSGAAIAAVAIYHRWYRLFVSVFLYGLGIILTVGFSPQHPHDLNIHACFFTLVVSLIIYGIIIRNQFSYLAGIAVLCIGLAQSDSFSVFVKNLNLTEPGTIAGVFGIGCIIFYLLFGQKLHKAFQVVGALCLAVFIYDLLPEYIHWLYIIVLPATGCLIGLLWFIRKNILVMAILFAPFLVKLYVMAKYLAYWRLVILGFVLLAAGAVASLFKRPSGKSDQPAPPAENQ